MTSLSAFPEGTSPTLSPLSSSAAEALLSRARRLSSNANKHTKSPTSFAEGEDPAALSTAYSSATSSNSHLHQLHRNSFNSYIREQNKKRSSNQHQRLSSSSTVKSADESPSSPESPCPSKPLSATPSEHTPSEHTRTPTAVVVISPSEDDDKQEMEQQTEQTQQTQQTQEQQEVAIVTAGDDILHNNSESSSSDLTESSTSKCSLAVVTRPRALTLDSTQETESSTAANTSSPLTTSTTSTTTSSTTTIAIESAVVTTDSTTSTDNMTISVDKHRRHQSENGTYSGLVHGILEALRDGGPESKSSSSQEGRKDSGVIMTSAISTSIQTHGLAQGLAQGHSQETRQETTTAESSSTLAMSSKEGSSEFHGSSPPTALTAVANITPSPNVSLSAVDENGATKNEKEQPPLPVQQTEENAPAPPSKTDADKAPQRLSINTSTAIIPPRSSSTLESGVSTAKHAPTNTPNNTPVATNTLLSPMTPNSKTSRRGSKLFGKLVPKFLQTSFTPGSGGGSGSSPRSAHPSTSSPSSSSKVSSPVVTRPTRSSTFSGSGSTSDAKRPTLPALPMIPPLILEAGEFERSPDATSPTAPAEPGSYLECLRSNSVKSTPSLSARRSSCSSDVSKRSNLSVVYSMSSVDPAESHSRIEGITEEKTEDLVHQDKQPLELEQPTHSPYTIDENCDDDFFLNSVLRKSRGTHQQQQQSPHLSSISTTWMTSGTPALSGTASQSSSLSGSPTSPVASPSVLSSSPQSHHFRSYSTPVSGSPFVVGLDEKRSRLRDAVGEWRRAANASSPIYSHSPSASFSN
ncbi:MAG: hypothetical protein BYD32DRAFT_418104 [Podila humilis]|nr:MAG: hypothetical protein BYD32DRAFT_418104 [Podila humilis]